MDNDIDRNFADYLAVFEAVMDKDTRCIMCGDTRKCYDDETLCMDCTCHSCGGYKPFGHVCCIGKYKKTRIVLHK